MEYVIILVRGGGEGAQVIAILLECCGGGDCVCVCVGGVRGLKLSTMARSQSNAPCPCRGAKQLTPKADRAAAKNMTANKKAASVVCIFDTHLKSFASLNLSRGDP